MAKRNLQFTAVLQLNSRARAFADKSAAITEEVMRDIVEYAAEIARENVAPGKGPSPHDDPNRHRYQDTGILQEHVLTAIWLQGFLTEGSVFTDLDYGVYLELGWHRRTGGGALRFYRYPWLKPAFLQAMKRLPDLAAERFRTQMTDLDEDQLVTEESIDSWVAACQRWAENIAKTKPPTKSPEVQASPGSANRIKRPRVFIRTKPPRHGRKTEPVELGEKLPGDRGRVRKERAEQKRHQANAARFDTKKARAAGKSHESNQRSSIDLNKVLKQHADTEKRREIRSLKDIAETNARLKRRADQRQAEAERKLREAAERLRNAGKNITIKKRKKKR